MAIAMISRTAVLPVAAGLAGILSLALFGGMHSVIKAGHGVIEEREALPTIDFVRLMRDTSVETLSRVKPPPPPPAPPPPPKMKIASSTVTQGALTGLEIPDLALNANVGGEAMMGRKGGAAMFDGDIIPLQCPPVSYPSAARRAGLSGWVQIEFVVGPDGSVKSAKAVEAQPRGVFEAAAITAAQRCRFKPKTVDGKPVEQRGRRKWNFDLSKSGG
ncbi:MAG: energy transducer TonB [Gammaproteobacteria bacterium]|nr:energy transducer TonB [Gammaproteobacteria bacterium]